MHISHARMLANAAEATKNALAALRARLGMKEPIKQDVAQEPTQGAK
jgi:hypothetical protein